MEINIFVLKGDLNAKIVVVGFFIRRVYKSILRYIHCKPIYNDISWQ